MASSRTWRPRRSGAGQTRMTTGTNPLGFSISNPCLQIQNPPTKKPMTCDGFNFVPKPVPIRLVGTHRRHVGIKSNDKISIYMYIYVYNSTGKNNIHDILKYMHATLM
jgi:hypothetical protein